MYAEICCIGANLCGTLVMLPQCYEDLLNRASDLEKALRGSEKEREIVFGFLYGLVQEAAVAAGAENSTLESALKDALSYIKEVL